MQLDRTVVRLERDVDTRCRDPIIFENGRKFCTGGYRDLRREVQVGDTIHITGRGTAWGLIVSDVSIAPR